MCQANLSLAKLAYVEMLCPAASLSLPCLTVGPAFLFSTMTYCTGVLIKIKIGQYHKTHLVWVCPLILLQ